MITGGCRWVGSGARRVRPRTHLTTPDGWLRLRVVVGLHVGAGSGGDVAELCVVLCR